MDHLNTENVAQSTTVPTLEELREKRPKFLSAGPHGAEINLKNVPPLSASNDAQAGGKYTGLSKDGPSRHRRALLEFPAI